MFYPHANMKRMFQKKLIETLVAFSSKFTILALVKIWEYQTESEQSSNSTHVGNGVGFGKWDAKAGSFLVLEFKKTGILNYSQLEKARKLVVKYRRQVIEFSSTAKLAKLYIKALEAKGMK